MNSDERIRELEASLESMEARAFQAEDSLAEWKKFADAAKDRIAELEVILGIAKADGK